MKKKLKGRSLRLLSEADGLTLKKVFKMVRLTVFCFLISLFQAMAIDTYSQMTRLSLNLRNESIEDVLKTIEDESDYFFLYNKDLIKVEQKVDVTVEDETIKSILDNLFEGTDISYEVFDRQIVLSNNYATSELSSQQKTISGKVTDETGQPMPGVTIAIKGTTLGTSTDSNGNYLIANLIPNNSILVFSFVGMVSQEIKFENQTSIHVIMKSDAIGIDEVIAVGYGVQKKMLNTGSTFNIRGEELQRLNNSSPMDGLKGISAGVNIIQNNGVPGSGTKVLIRGAGTIGNSNPLYIVDGISVGDIDFLSSSDIESIDVLKDAASAAIYGSRAANGVILVTTKKGALGKKPLISYDFYYGLQSIAKNPNVLDAQQYVSLINEANINSFRPIPNYSKLVPNWEAIESGESSGTHWFDEVYQKNAPVQSHSVNITSGNQVSTFAFGFSHLSQKGIIGKQTNNEYQRTNLRFNSEHILLKKANQNILTFGENLNYSNTQKPTIRTGNIYWNDLHNMIVTSPLLPMYAEDKSDLAYPYHYATRWNGFEANPVASMIYNTKYETNQNSSIVANIYAEFEPLKNLKFRSSFGINTWFGSSRKWVPVYNLNEQSVTYNDRVTQSMWLGYTNTLTNTLAYSFKLKEKNNFSVILGQEATKNRINQSLSNSNDSTRFNDYEYAYISNTDITNIANINMSGRDDFGWGMLSYFGRVSYDYKETILATVILRSDGSSNFAEGHRWGTFPSVSLGYILSNAPFIKNLRGLDYLKLRGSWGQNGNQDITKYQYLATLSTQSSNYTFGTDRSQYSVGYFPARIPNPNVTWETSEQTSLGFDAQFLKNRLVVNFDVYNKITKDWLVVAPQLATNGTDAPFINGGTISNKGFELVLGWKDNIGDFKYGTSFSLAKNKNEVTDIANNEKIIHGPSGVLLAGMSELFRAQVGYPIGYFWGYETNGLIQNATDSADYVRYFKDIRPGDIRFVDQNNDSIIDKLDKVMLGDPNPDYIFGFQLSAEYKGFYMEVTANGLAGNQIAKAYRSGGAKANFTEYDLGRWHGEGTSNKLPRIDAQVHPRNDLWVSNRFIEDADFLRISNLTIGYDLNSLFAKSPIRQARIYFTAKNLYTFTNYSGMDPEVGYGPDGYSWASGIDLGLYPSARTYMVGISVKF